MFSNLISLFSNATSDDGKTVVRWRLTITVLVVSCCGVLLIFSGAMTSIGVPSVAFAEDVDKKIETALKPVTAQLTLHDGYLKRLVKSDIRDDLYNKLEELCRSEDSEHKQEIRDEINDLQTEYKAITGSKDNYPLPSCGEL